jgi:hypothetical protein
MTTTINAVSGTGLTQTSDGSGIVKLQSDGKTTNALAYVGFTGSAGSVLNSYNVTSVTRSSTGVYVINFTNALPSANYVVVGMDKMPSSGNYGGVYTGTATTTTCQIFTNYSGTVYDAYYAQIVVFAN